MTNSGEPLESALDDSFFADAWRRRPVLLKGAAHVFLPEPPNAGEFEQLLQGEPDDLPGRVRTDGKSIWFLESVRDQVSGVGDLCKRASRLLEWPNVWCDVFRTKGSSSIGAHYDDSDNFSIQIEGVKRWRLAPPEGIPLDDRRLRVLGGAGVGRAEIDGEAGFEYVLEAGDVLYIPLLWRHWGVSDSDSFSVSLAVNVSTPWHHLCEAIRTTTRRDPEWFQPLAVGPGSPAVRDLEVSRAVESLSLPGNVQRLVASAQASMSAPNGRLSEPESVPIDLDRVRAFIGARSEVPTEGLVFLTAGGVEASLAVQRLLAARNLRDLLKFVTSRRGQTSDVNAQRLYRLVLEALSGLDDPQLDGVLTDPDITSWIEVARLESTTALPVKRDEDPLAHALAFSLLPEIADLGADTVEMVVMPDADGGLTLRRGGVRFAGHPSSRHWSLHVDAGAVRAVDDQGRSHDKASPTTTIVERFGGRGPHLLPVAPGWLRSHLPDTESIPLSTSLDVGAGVANLARAIDLVHDVWPAAGADLVSRVRSIVLMSGEGLRPRNFSVHAFRGQIVTSVRPPLMAAQSLIHEAAHNEMSSLLDVISLCHNPSERAVSPVVEQDRPLTALFQGMFAFAREVYLSQRMLDRGIPSVEGTDLESYRAGRAEIVARTVEVLRGKAVLTNYGEVVVAEVEQSVG